MYEKYLPIGTIVKLKGLDKKIIIIGYYSLEYSNSITIYDYVGCKYPEGLLVKNNLVSFNHEEIISVEFIGYEDYTYNDLNNKLKNQLTDVEELESSIDDAMQHGTSNANTDFKKEINNLYTYEDNAINDDENYEDEQKKLFDINEIDVRKDPNIESDYPFMFDENQNINSLNEDVINNTPTSENYNQDYMLDKEDFTIVDEKEILTTNITQENTEEFPMPHYEFDENGIIINN